ncbi:hypothetical protein ILUMI_18749 [Ignelater luminosus]|uniref:Uncharacterized protein n=1 Tax=Ignelater luminosus TaxID=2038154 RepID=A0A8K0CPH0_IGNLU|nr:hypothetical protein ILUMI_18749 [Ignelater luminosus]
MKPVKVVSTLRKKQVSQIALAERGELVTFVGIINAVGQSFPPVEIELGDKTENDEHVSLKDSDSGNVLDLDIPIYNSPSCSFTKQNIFKKVKITPESVTPYPKAGEKKQKSKRRTGSSKIYTDTPEKDELKEIEREKLLKI